MASLKTATKNLFKGLGNLSVKSDPYIAEGEVLVPSAFRGNPGWFFGPNGVDYRFQFTDKGSPGDAFNRCPPLAAIIGRKAQAYTNGQTWIMDAGSKESTAPEALKIKKLFARPNFIQTWKQFEAEQYIILQLYGWCVTRFNTPYGFNFLDAGSMWNLEPDLLNIKETNTAFYEATSIADVIQSISFDYRGAKRDVDLNSVYIFRELSPSPSSKILAKSRIQALAMPINNIIAAYESRNELINYAGSQGILTPETDLGGPLLLKEGDKEQLQADFKRQYGIKRGQSRYIISPAAMKWQQMGRPTRDLMLFEEIQDDIMRLCDGFGYPSPLLNSDKGPAVANTREFKAQVYQDSIIPESMNLMEQWQGAFKLDPSKMKIMKDFDHIPVLKSDQVDDGKARWYLSQGLAEEFQNNVITLNQWREEQGVDTIPGDGDKYYYELIAEGWVFGSAKGSAPPGNTQENNQNQNQNNETANTSGTGTA